MNARRCVKTLHSTGPIRQIHEAHRGRQTMRPVETVAIIGAGNMGSGIAQKTAQEMFDVQMVDREEQWVERGQNIISDFLDEALERRIFSEKQVNEIKSRIKGVVGTENVNPKTDLIIEAVFEDFNIKKDVFETLDEVCSEHTILASNTSSLSVNSLAEATGRPDRFVGLHFFYHPAKNRLIEVIPGEKTSEDTLARVVQYCKMTGKVVIICKDRPGFVVNRFFVPWLNEACLLLEQEVATAAQIDSVACKAFGIGMGPFALMNLTGPPIALHSTDYLCEQLNCSRYRGAENLRELVASGEMWKIEGDTEVSDDVSKMISERLLGQVFAVSAQIVEEEICSIEDVDRGAKVGLRWSLGPFELANKIGVEEADRMAQDYADLAGFELPDFLPQQAEIGTPFEFDYVDMRIDGGIATISLNRPEAMNALNEVVVSQLGKKLQDANARDDVSTIVLDGAGKAFVAGADVKFFVDKIRSDSIPDIVEFTKKGHEIFNMLETSSKTTIALTTGLALGGGLELALSCDYRIGTRRTQFRFPETSIGIYPGLGGTQRPARICGIPVARWAVLAGNFMDSKTANDLGLVTHLVQPSEVDSIVKKLSEIGKPSNKYPRSPANLDNPVVKFAASFYSDENMNTLLSGSPPEGFSTEDNLVARQMKSLSRTAPIALRMASELIDSSSETDLTGGLKGEIDGLSEIFATSDALEGLSALIEGRKPAYLGK